MLIWGKQMVWVNLVLSLTWFICMDCRSRDELWLICRSRTPRRSGDEAGGFGFHLLVLDDRSHGNGLGNLKMGSCSLNLKSMFMLSLFLRVWYSISWIFEHEAMRSKDVFVFEVYLIMIEFGRDRKVSPNSRRDFTRGSDLGILGCRWDRKVNRRHRISIPFLIFRKP